MLRSILCLNCVCLHFRRNQQISMGKRTSNVRSRKIRGLRTSRASKNSKTAENRTRTGVPQGCTAVHPGQKATNPCSQSTASRAGTHGRPCAGRTAVRRARTAVRGGTAGRAFLARPAVRSWHGRAVPLLRAVRDFFGLFIRFCFSFSSPSPLPLLNLLRAFFRLELGIDIRIVRLD